MLAVLLAGDLWLELRGVPPFAKAKALSALQEYGLQVRGDDLRLGVFRGLVLHKVTFRDPLMHGWEVMQADSVRLHFDLTRLWRGQLRLGLLDVRNGALRLPLDCPTGGGETLVLNRMNGKVRLAGDKLSIDSLKVQLEGLRLSLRGQVHLQQQQLGGPRPKSEAPQDDAAKAFSFKPYLTPLREAFCGDALARIRQFCQSAGAAREARVDLNLVLPPDAVGARADLEAQFSGMVHQGLAIESLRLRARYSNHRIEVEELRLDLDEREQFEARLTLHLDSRQVEGRVTSRCYPRKLLKPVFPDLIARLGEVKFHGPPPQLFMTVLPSPLGDPAKWNLRVWADATEVQIADAAIHSLSGVASCRDGRLTIEGLRARLEPDTDIAGNAEWLPAAKQLVVNAKLDGDPNVIARFSRSPSFRRHYLRVWQRFGWDRGSRPHFEASLYVSSPGPKPQFVLQATSHMRGARYNGVYADAARANVYVDSAQRLLLLDNMQVNRHGAQATGNLAWHYDKARRELIFAGHSEIEAEAMMGLINPRWAELPNKWRLQLPRNPVAAVRGYYGFNRNAPRQITGRVTAESFSLAQTDFGESRAELAFDGDVLSAQVDAASVAVDDCEMAQAKARLTFDGAALTFKGTANALARDKWQLTGLAAEGVYREGRLASTVKVKKTVHVRLAIAGVHGKLDWENARLQADLQAKTVGQPDLFRMDKVSCRADITAAAATFSGEIAGLKHFPSRGGGEKVTVANGAWSKDKLEMDVQAGKWTLADKFTFEKPRAHIVKQGREVAAKLTIASGRCEPDGVARGISGACHYRDGATKFKLAWDEVEWSNTKLRQATTEGTHRRGIAHFRLAAKELRWGRYPLTQVEAHVQQDAHFLMIPDLAGKLHGGDADANIVYDFEKKEGKLTLGLGDVSLDPLIGEAKPTPGKDSAEIGGKLSGQTSVRFARTTDKLRLSGRGDLHVRQGNLWRVPVISEFLALLNTVKVLKLLPTLGDNITALDAEFELADERVRITRLKTDGGLVAISGHGFYWWPTRGVDMRVQAHLLETKANVFRKVFDMLPNPFKPLLVYRLSGTIQKRKWELMSSVFDLLRDTKDPTDPSLKQAPKPE